MRYIEFNGNRSLGPESTGGWGATLLGSALWNITTAIYAELRWEVFE